MMNLNEGQWIEIQGTQRLSHWTTVNVSDHKIAQFSFIIVSPCSTLRSSRKPPDTNNHII